MLTGAEPERVAQAFDEEVPDDELLALDEVGDQLDTTNMPALVRHAVMRLDQLFQEATYIADKAGLTPSDEDPDPRLALPEHDDESQGDAIAVADHIVGAQLEAIYNLRGELEFLADLAGVREATIEAIRTKVFEDVEYDSKAPSEPETAAELLAESMWAVAHLFALT